MIAPAKPYYTILGIDPGKTNAAYSVVRIKIKPFRYRILAHGMLKKPLNDLTGIDVVKRMNAFKAEIRKLKKTYSVNFVIAERFMTRGGQSMGTTIEVVTFMLALLAHVGIKEYQFITAAQWKNQWNRHNDLKEFYKSMPFPPHPIDATGIALYGASQQFAEDIPCFKALDNIKEFTKQLLAANKEPIHEKRTRRSKKETVVADGTKARPRTRKKANEPGREGKKGKAPVKGRKESTKPAGRTKVRPTRATRTTRSRTRKA